MYILLATRVDGMTYYSSTTTMDFTRSGTTWNLAAVILVGGIGLVETGAFFIASRRRGGRRLLSRTR